MSTSLAIGARGWRRLHDVARDRHQNQNSEQRVHADGDSLRPPNSSRLAHSGRTGTGLLVSFSGGSFGGEISRADCARTRDIPAASPPSCRSRQRRLHLRSWLEERFEAVCKAVVQAVGAKTSCCASRGTLDRTLGQKILEVGPEAGRDQPAHQRRSEARKSPAPAAPPERSGREYADLC